MKRLREWYFKGWTHEDYVAVRFMGVVLAAFTLGVLLGRVL